MLALLEQRPDLRGLFLVMLLARNGIGLPEKPAS
jgi:hypothetical protein